MATETTIKTRLLSAYKTASTWTSLNPVLKKGEIGFESDTGLYKVGDGSTAWSSLSYAVDSALSSTSSKPLSNKAINTALNNKVDKVSGKGLSTNDYTTDEKTKLSGIDAGANKTTVDSALSSSSTNPVQNKVINTALSGKLGTSGDSKDNTTTFTSGDAADSSVSRTTGWSTVAALATGEKHSSLFNKVSTMMKNVRYLYKLLGTTDISSLSTDGTVTGALSKLNTESTPKTYTYLTDKDDLNDIHTTGIYSISTTIPRNVPTDGTTWSFVLVLGAVVSNAMRIQIYMCPIKGTVALREFSGYPGSWTAWVKLAMAT